MPLRLLMAVWLLALVQSVAAHPMPESRVWVDTDPAGVRLTLELPLNQLEFAFGRPLADTPQEVLPRHEAALVEYLLQHVGIRGGSGSSSVGWQVFRPTLKVTGVQDRNAELVVMMRAVAPAGADPRRLTLWVDAITHEVKTHRMQVFLRNDWYGGVVSAPPQPLGQLDAAQTSLSLDLAPPRAGTAVLALFVAGALHIAEGTDHLLFLLLLLLAAPSTALAGRWVATLPVGLALRRVAWVVSAFTLGHSLTLAIGSLGWMHLPEQWVEVAVAATIGVAAVHAWRPLFAAAETWMALGFGLVHGLAFSSVLSGAGLTAGQHAVALLAFNLGIEAMQFALVALVLPPLLVVASIRSQWFTRLRGVMAMVSLYAAAAWTAERLGLFSTTNAGPLADPAAWLPWLLPALWLVAVMAWRPTWRLSR